MAAGIVVLAALGSLLLTAWRSAPPVIAVLPFENLSTEPDSDYFVDGLTDEIIGSLAVIDGLEVRSRTSSFAFKNEPRNLRDVGEQLGANLVVEGSVQRSGDRLRVTARLIEVSGDVPLWSEQFDRTLEDVFAIQDEISRAIVNRLRLTLGRGQRRYDADVETYDLYLKGRALVSRGGIPSVQEAAALFEQAFNRDPAYAPAYAGLANAYALMSQPMVSLPFATALATMRPAAVKAQNLDPLLAESQVAMGWVHSYERDWANAERTFQRAIELNPSLSQTYTSYSLSTLRPLGKHEQALRLLRVALRNDPLSLDVLREIGSVQVEAGQYDAAIVTLEKARAVDPDFPFVESFLAGALMYAGRLSEAIALMEGLDGRNLGRFRAGAPPRRAPQLALAYHLIGRQSDAEAVAAEHSDTPAYTASFYAVLGDKDRTFDALEQLSVTAPHHVGRLLVRPEMTALQGDPRLSPFRKRFSLP